MQPNLTSRNFLLASAFTLFSTCNCAERELHRFAFNQPSMGTTFRVVLFAQDETSAAQAARAAFDRIDQLDSMMTDYNEASELMRLCSKAGGPPVKVSDELFDILEKAVLIHAQTKGAFDITVGPVVKLWRAARKTNQLPDPEELARAQALVGSAKIVLNKKDRSVQLLKAGMKLDLGGIAKGYAVDRALELLRKKGFPSALVVGGGDVGVSDAPPGKAGWVVEVQPLDRSHIPVPVQLLLKNAGASTSGSVEQHFDKVDKRYSHIVDPKTGKAMEGDSSVTIVAPNSTTSDGLAKIGVLGPIAALDAIEKLPDCAALIVFGDRFGTTEYTSKSWDNVPKVQP